MKASGDFSIGSQVWPGTSKLIEEMGELQQVLGKLMATAGDTAHWSGDLRQMLIDELADVSAAVRFFSTENFTREQLLVILERADKKLALFQKRHADPKPPPEPAKRAVCLTCQPSKVMTITATLPSVPACAVCGKPCTGGYWQEPEPAKTMTEAERKELHGLRAARNALVSCGGPLCDEDAARLNELQAKEDAARAIPPEPAKPPVGPTCKRCGKPREAWQVFCGAACSARWEDGDRDPAKPEGT